MAVTIVAVALEVMNIKPQPVAVGVALALLLAVTAMVAAVVRAVRVLAVSSCSFSTSCVG